MECSIAKKMAVLTKKFEKLQDHVQSLTTRSAFVRDAFTKEFITNIVGDIQSLCSSDKRLQERVDQAVQAFVAYPELMQTMRTEYKILVEFNGNSSRAKSAREARAKPNYPV